MIPDLLKVQESEPASGILEILPDGYGFLRGHTLLPGKKDIYVSMAQIRRFGLRTGDLVEGTARSQRDSDKFAALLTVDRSTAMSLKKTRTVYPLTSWCRSIPTGALCWKASRITRIWPFGSWT